MSTWTIYRRNTDPDRNPVASAHELEFHGEWMGDEYVSVTVKSPVPIDFHFGDCLTYRGTRYEIDYDPNFIKKARRGSYGEGFVYENIKLHSISARLKHIGFKDVVLNTLADNANKLVYSSLGTFSFFASSVEDLADRIQANLNRDNGTLWNVFTPDRNRTYQRVDSHVPSTAWGNYYDGNEDKGEKDIDVQASDMSCMDALRLCYNTFGLSFYCIGTLIIIGGKPLTVDYGFEYGKGKGLYEIERTSDDTQKIVTKLFAYGSERNLPINYYAMLHKRAYVTGNRATHRVVRSENEFPYIQTDIPFISVSGKFTGNGTCQVEYGGRTCDGVFADIEEKLWIELTPRGSSYSQAFWDRLGTGSVKVYINSGVNINTWPYVENSSSSQSNYPALLSINRLMLPGFPDVSLYDWVIANGGTSVDASAGKATWRGYTAYFSKDKSDPWIKSLFADQLGIREGTVNFDSGDEEIYPTIEGTGFDEVKWSEQIEDNGYLDGDDATFELKPMRVNGDDGEIQWNYSGDTVSISMKDGYCVGREFTVKSARLNDDKEWVLKLERRKDDSLGIYFPYKYGNSELYQIWGRDNRSGSAGDHFVVLGIPLPKSYVDIAAAKLLEESLKHLMEIDHPQYTYIPRIDEIEMARQHDRATASGGSVVSVHDTISAGMQMRVDDDDLSIHYLPFIDTITIKENGSNGIPTYDVVLRDEKELTMMERIQSEIRGSRGTVVAGGISGEYLSRVNDDTAQGFIRFIQGLQISERFTTGLLGEGGVFRKEADGTTYIEADKLYIRMKAYFDNVEIRDYQHSSGNRIATQARGFSCARVEWIDASGNVLEQKEENLPSVQLFRCYWRVDDGEHKNDNQFRIGDLAFCQFSDVSNSSLVINRFWRLVVGRNSGLETTEDGEAWIDLSNAHNSNGTPKMVSFTYTGQGGVQKTMSALSFEPGSGVPTEENDICQLGSVNDRDRQGAIIEFVTGADAPSYQIFQEIGSDASNPYSLHNKNYIALGYSTQTGRAYMNVYGDMFIGEAPDSQGNSRTYIHYYQKEETDPETGQTITTPTMDIKANVIFQSPDTGEDTSLVEYVNEILSEFQDQIDGVIDTYYMEGTPTMNNKPVTDWIAGVTDEEEKKAIYKQHIGDIYYQMDTDQGYRFLRDDQGVYSWVEITDEAQLAALRMAKEAVDLADSKMRVFVTQPVPPYGLGDLWVNAKYPATVQEGEERLYDDVILRCKTAKDEDGTFNINDWTPAQNYSELYNFIEGQYADDMQKIERQLDKKAETWYQDTDPSSAWQTQQEDTRSEHVGDIWYDTSANGGNKTYVYQYDSSRNRYYWQETSVPDEVFDKIDGKAEIYVTKPTTYNERDLWIIGDDVLANDMPAGCQKGDIVIASNMPAGVTKRTSYVKGDWVKKDRYTDDSTFNTFLNGTYKDFVDDIQSQLDGKAETWYQATDPSANWNTSELKQQHKGDIWHNSSSTTINGVGAGLDAIWNGTSWVVSDVPQGVYDKIDGKASIYTSKPSSYEKNDLWILEKQYTLYGGVTYPQGELVTATQSSTTFNASHWTKKVKYTDDSSLEEFKLNQYVAQLLNGTISTNITNAQAAAEAHADSQVATLDYVKTALKQHTDVVGGLVLSTLIALRDGNNRTWSGINGAYKASETGTGYKGHGIAAWFGGAMTDKEVDTTATDYAKSLFRFDGSGYVAGGNLKWDKDGNVTIQGYDIKVNGESVAVGNLNDYVTVATDQTITGHKTFGTGNGSYIQIGDIRLVYDQSNNALKVVASDGSSVANFYATGGVSALGIGSGGSSGISIEAVWTALANSDSSKQINASHLTNALSGYNPTNNFKTINGNSIIGTGDITIEGGSGGVDMTAVWQSLAANTTEQINATHLTTALSDYLPLTGGTLTGNLNINNANLSVTGNGSMNQLTVGSGSINSVITTVKYTSQSGYGFKIIPDTNRLADFYIFRSNYTSSSTRYSFLYTYFDDEGINTLQMTKSSSENNFNIGKGFASRSGHTNLWGYSINFRTKVGGSTSTTHMSITNDGNVGIGIGTTSPSYKLHVGGTFYASGNSSVGGTFGVTGATTLSSTLSVSGLITASGGITIPSGKTLTIGDAVLSWDSTNQGIKITKGLYSETFISALGKGSGGSSGISIEAVWTALANSDSSKQINASHLTNALAGYNPTSNFKTINGNSIIGTGDIAVSAGTGTVTSIVTGGTTYSPTNGVVTLPDYIVYTNENQSYLNASFLKAEYSQKAAQKYIEFWDSTGGWFNFKLGTLYAVSDVKVGNNSVIHTGNIGSQSVNYANSASTLTNKSVTASTIDGLAGSFTFEGNELTTSGYDEVGIQIGSSVDKFQIIGKSGTLLIRQNDNGGTSTSGWSDWTMLPTKMYTRNLLTKTDQWYRVANLTTYGMSYIISIRESYFNREPTPVTFIINTSYTNATITQIGRASRTPVSITKVRLVKYGNGTYHVELYTPELSGTSLASMSTSEVNIFNLGRENTSDGIILVHDTSDNTKWLEVDENIASGETLIEEATISTENYATSLKTSRSLWGQSFDGTADVSGTITSSYFKIQDSSTNPYLQFVGGSSNMYLQYFNNAMYMGTGTMNSIMINTSGNVGIGITSPAYKLDVNGDVQATNFRGNFVGNADSATKLKTARTIWGQSFDGTANVSGAITGATTISASSNVSVGGTLSVTGTSTLTGHVGIGTSPHSKYVLRADGEVYVSTGLYSHGYVTALSDIRHKDVMGDVKLTVSEVANAPAVKFLWKDRRQEGLQVGSIAQYWQKVMPEAIVEAADGELTMSYGVIALLASIATARKVEDHERRIAELERENKMLKQMLNVA